MIRPLPRTRPGWHRRPVQPAAPLPAADAAADRAQDRASALEAPAGPGGHRRPGRAGALDRAPDSGGLPDQPALARRPGHRRTDPPLRDDPPRRARPRRHQEAGQHPRRRRLAQTRQGRRRTQHQRPSRSGPAAQGARPPEPGLLLRALRHRRLHPAGLLRDPRRRDRRHRAGLLDASTGLLRRTRHHRGAGAHRQRRGLQEPRLARRARTVGYHALPHPSPSSADQWQGRTPQPHPARGVGLQAALHLRENRRAALSGWLHHYNHHRPNTALGNLPPISRCTNVSEQYT